MAISPFQELLLSQPLPPQDLLRFLAISPMQELLPSLITLLQSPLTLPQALRLSPAEEIASTISLTQERAYFNYQPTRLQRAVHLPIQPVRLTQMIWLTR